MKGKTRFYILLFCIAFPDLVYSQSDSLVLFQDLKYHSEFEKTAFENYILHNRDTFNLFLAINENITEKDAVRRHDIYVSIIKDLENQNIVDKKMQKKIRISYAQVHDRFLKKYSENEFFPAIFETGIYNCVTASMLYALVFESFDIPYKIMASPSHVYLVANPGSKSIVIETTNPGFEEQIFTGEFKQQYVNYLKSSKLISDSEYKSKSNEEIFEEKFKEVKEAEFNHLMGFQYYNKALTKIQNNQLEEALKLCQKSYFFWPDNQVKTLLYTCLLYYIENCNFDNIADADYLAQLSRFDDVAKDVTVVAFNNALVRLLQYTDKEKYCNSLYNRLVSQIVDEGLIEEIEFNYNLQMSYRYQGSEKIEKYVSRALELKGNHHDSQVMMENYLIRKLNFIFDPEELSDTISAVEKRLNNDVVNSILFENKLRIYLLKANDSFNSGKYTESDKALAEFEKICEVPVRSPVLISLIENIYHSIATNYYYMGYKTKSRDIANRGLKYVPGSPKLKIVAKRR